MSLTDWNKRDIDKNKKRNDHENENKYYRNTICVNCGLLGHIYRECKDAITSFGIVAFRDLSINSKFKKCQDSKQDKFKPEVEQFLTTLRKENPEIKNETLKFLMIQRKDTIGFIDTIRGKYPKNEPERSKMLNIYFSEMTINEREILETKNFDELWQDLWWNKQSKTYINEYSNAKYRFENLNVKHYLNTTTTKWIFSEFGFAKGRRSTGEQNLVCAQREFSEETGYNGDDYRFIVDYPIINEEFIGTNNQAYRHVYYLAKMNDDSLNPHIDYNNKNQIGEVQNLGWFSFTECKALIRDYDDQKLKILEKVNEDVLKMRHMYVLNSKYDIKRPKSISIKARKMKKVEGTGSL